MPSISLTSTKNSVSYSVTGLSTSNYGTVWVDLYLNSVKQTTHQKTASNCSGTFSGLSSGTTYLVYVYAEGKNGGSAWSGSKSIATEANTNTIKCTISFDANGGSGAPSSMTRMGSSTSTSGTIQVTIPSTKPTKNGYTFQYWTLSGYGDTYKYYAGSTYGFEATTSGVSWTLVASYTFTGYTVSTTVSFNANGGSGAPSPISGSTTSQNETGEIRLTIPTNTPTRSGYEFQYWTLYGYGDTYKYYPGNTYGFTGTRSGNSWTLVAQWVQVYTIKCTVKFDANGGSGAPSNATGTGTVKGSTSGMVKVTIPTTRPTRDGYTFKNWKLSGYEYYYSPGVQYEFAASTDGVTHTLIAQWDRVGTISYIWNGSAWLLATPYIWSGSSWQEVVPNIYTSSGWL